MPVFSRVLTSFRRQSGLGLTLYASRMYNKSNSNSILIKIFNKPHTKRGLRISMRDLSTCIHLFIYSFFHWISLQFVQTGPHKLSLCDEYRCADINGFQDFRRIEMFDRFFLTHVHSFHPYTDVDKYALLYFNLFCQ